MDSGLFITLWNFIFSTFEQFIVFGEKLISVFSMPLSTLLSASSGGVLGSVLVSAFQGLGLDLSLSILEFVLVSGTPLIILAIILKLFL